MIQRKLVYLVRYSIQSSGIWFYNLPSSDVEPKRLFDLLSTLKVGQDFKIASGHLSLVSMPASPKDAFYNVDLKIKAGNIQLYLKQEGEFAQRSLLSEI